MYLIDESVASLQEFWKTEPSVEEIRNGFEKREAFTDRSSMWMDYKKSCSEQSPVMQYKVENPQWLINELHKMWEDNKVLFEDDFIKLFVVSAYRQTMKACIVREEETAQSEASIPSYIYNF